MMRTLLVGAGEVGRKHLIALAATPQLAVVGIVEPAPLPAELVAGVPVFTEDRRALATLRPELVVVATPPGTSLRIAREAAATGARVLVEKPVVIDPDELEPDVVDARIAVAFQPHFAPGLAELLTGPPKITRAHVMLSCRRDAHYYRGWRARWASAGGILHQQATHGLALALRLLPDVTPTSCAATVEPVSDGPLSAQYFTVSGSAVDYGEDGLVGRGNFRHGLISPAHVAGNEVTFGKNPTYHVGKVGGWLADHAAAALAQVAGPCRVGLAWRIGADYDDPATLQITTRNPGAYRDAELWVREALTERDWLTDLVDGQRYRPRIGPVDELLAELARAH